MDGVFAIKLEDHHVLRLDRSAGKAGAVGIDEVERRRAVDVEPFDREPVLSGLVEIPVEPATILLSRAVLAGDGTSAAIDLPGSRNEAIAEEGAAALIKQALAGELAVADEVVEKPPVILEEAAEAPILEAGIDGGQMILELPHAGARPERTLLADRGAV